jgi:hypothetical protein
MRRVAGAGRAARRRDLLDGQRVRDVVEARAAVGLGHEDAEGAELPEPRQDFAREPPGPVVLRRHRLDALLRERAHRVPELALRLGELDEHADRRS